MTIRQLGRRADVLEEATFAVYEARLREVDARKSGESYELALQIEAYIAEKTGLHLTLATKNQVREVTKGDPLWSDDPDGLLWQWVRAEAREVLGRDDDEAVTLLATIVDRVYGTG